MKKYIIALLLLTPALSFASTNTTSVKINGSSSFPVVVTPNSSVSVEVTVQTTQNDDLESIHSDWLYDGVSGQCHDVSNELFSGTYTKTFNHNAPSSNGLYDLEIKAYGTNGNNSNENCAGNEDDTSLFADVLKVEAVIVPPVPPAPVDQCDSDPGFQSQPCPTKKGSRSGERSAMCSSVRLSFCRWPDGTYGNGTPHGVGSSMPVYNPLQEIYLKLQILSLKVQILMMGGSL